MDNKKRKSAEITQKKKGALVVSTVRSQTEISIDSDPDFWSKEIEAVQQETYESVEAAIDAIAERVVRRMSSPTIDDVETKKFVTELLSSNDEVVETIRSVLQIR